MLLGFEQHSPSQTLDLPGAVGLVRLIQQTSGRLALTIAPHLIPQGSLSPLVSRAIKVTKKHPSLILLEEDNETNRDVIQAQLQLLGYDSETAEDGKKALSMWQSNRFVLLLTDCHMPNMDDYLSKPLRMEDLAPLLEKWLPEPIEPAQVIASALAEDRPADILATWDSSTLTAMVGNDPMLHGKLLRKYLINAQQQVNAMVLAADAGELANAADIAHALKSSSRMVGALMLGELCEGMETAGESNDQVSCNTLVPYIKTTFDIAQQAITEHITLLDVS